MFKTNPDGMRMEPTPERVLSVCRLIAQKNITHEELRQAMTLGQNGDKEVDQINKSATRCCSKKILPSTSLLNG